MRLVRIRAGSALLLYLVDHRVGGVGGRDSIIFLPSVHSKQDCMQVRVPSLSKPEMARTGATATVPQTPTVTTAPERGCQGGKHTAVSPGCWWAACSFTSTRMRAEWVGMGGHEWE